MRNTQSKDEDVFGEFLGKDSISLDQNTKPNSFLAKIT